MTSRILLADDSITIQKVVNLTFADEGIEVVSVSNGEMAERRMGEINPDLVLADIFMPGKNGYELCEYIKESSEFHDVPVVLLVGAFEPFDQSEARRVRADGHLTKPFETRTLVETVRSLIEKNAKPQTDSLASLPPSRNDDREGESPEKPFEAGAIKTPRLNIDLSAMTDSWTPQETAELRGNESATTSTMDALNDASPLDIDYSMPSSSDTEFSGFETRTQQSMETVELSSLIEDDSFPHGQTLEMNVSTQTEPSYLDAQNNTDSGRLNLPVNNSALDAEENHEWEERRITSPLEPDFGDEGMVLDFEKVDEPDSHQPENIVSFDLETEPPSKQASGVEPGFATQESNEYGNQQIVEPEAVIASDESSQQQTGFELSFDTNTGYSGERAASFASSSLFTDEEPLGDLIDMDKAQEMAAGQEEGRVFEVLPAAEASLSGLNEQYLAGSEDAGSESFTTDSGSEPSKETSLEAKTASAPADEKIGFTTQEMATPDHREFISGTLLGSTSPFEIVEPEAEQKEADTVEQFKSSEMWTEEEMHFTPIDIEDAPLGEEPAFHHSPGATESEQEFTSSGAHMSADRPTRAADMSPDLLDEIVRRVVAEISDSVVREIAWEVVPDCVERVVEKLARESLSKRI